MYPAAMQPHVRALRLTLTLAFLITLYFAYLMLLNPSILMEIYNVPVFDTMHRYLAMTGGALMIMIAVGVGLAFFQPAKYAGILLLLIFYHFVRFIVDVVLIAQGDAAVTILLPEMVYFLFVCIALIRFFPVDRPEEPVEEHVEEPANQTEALPDAAPQPDSPPPEDALSAEAESEPPSL